MYVFIYLSIYLSIGLTLTLARRTSGDHPGGRAGKIYGERIYV